MMTTASERFAAVAEKYKNVTQNETAARPDASVVRRAFESTTKRASQTQQQRVGAQPVVASDELGAIFQEVNRIESELTDLAIEEGELKATYADTLSRQSQSFYTFWETTKFNFYGLTKQTEKRNALTKKALGRQGESIKIVIEGITQVIDKLHQKSIERTSHSRVLQERNIVNNKRLEGKIADMWEKSVTTGQDQFVAAEELKRYKGEIEEMDGIIAQYETEMTAAKAAGDVDGVSRLVEEVRTAIKMREGITDGTYMAEGVERTARYHIIDATEGLQSAKGALAQGRALYQMISLQRDEFDKMEIKYRHAKEDMTEILYEQAQVAINNKTLTKLKDVLVQVARNSAELTLQNEKAAGLIAHQIQDFMEAPTYDPVVAAQTRANLEKVRDEIIARELAWADAKQSVRDTAAQAMYGTHQ